MSLWDWIIEAIVGSGNNGPHNPSKARTQCERIAAGVVATLDRTAEGEEVPAEPDEPPWYAPEGVTCREPIPFDEPNLTHEDRALERALTSELDVHGLVLPPLPRVPEAVLRHLKKADSSLLEVADLISQDQVTATVVLRAANCPLWGVQKVTSLKEAVIRLGVNPMRTLMLSESVRSAAFTRERRDRELADLLWRRAVAGGCVMRALAEFTSRLDPEDAFVIGLLHDVGNVIVLHVVDRHQRFIRTRVDLGTFEYLCHQTHEQFGALIAEKWNLPPRLKELIENHHHHPTQDDPLRTERLHLILTDMINQMLGNGPSAAYDLPNARPVSDLALADGPAFTRFLATLPDQVEQNMAGF